MTGRELVDYLKQNALLLNGKVELHPSRVAIATLERLCDTGILLGGLSIASDVKPDEAVGSICVAIGGSALHLRVLDVLETPQAKILVSLDDREDEWPLSDIPELVGDLNRFFALDDGVKAIALLGEWEDSWQLWCLAKWQLPKLLDAGVLRHDQLKGLDF
jgi:hypothetical protein